MKINKLFSCLHNYKIFVILFIGMDLSGPNVATLYPNSVFTANGRAALVSNAVDGRHNVGQSGRYGATNCAITSWSTKNQTPKYLHFNLGGGQVIRYVKLRLRDGLRQGDVKRFVKQRGLTVLTAVTDNLTKADRCGRPYDPVIQKQSPWVSCKSNNVIGRYAQYIWVVLYTRQLLEICEVEVFYAGELLHSFADEKHCYL